MELPEGRHQYKFFVNGEWVHDPGEVRERERGMAVLIQCILQECQDNGLGTLNNVVTVTKNDFDVFNRMIDVSSFQKGNQAN